MCDGEIIVGINIAAPPIVAGALGFTGVDPFRHTGVVLRVRQVNNVKGEREGNRTALLSGHT